MESLGLGEVIGIGGVAVGAMYLIWKMWSDHTDLSKQVLEVVKENAKQSAELRAAIHTNTEVTRETKSAITTLVYDTLKSNQVTSK